ncbi:MAG: hypothetical protein KF730_17380 [Sphingomonas sp.]|nr:hypothetical protein [Sphingomonas sp.]MBX3566333.1 hypothetical protein [Sphingomonas sp.]
MLDLPERQIWGVYAALGERVDWPVGFAPQKSPFGGLAVILKSDVDHAAF